MDVSKNLPIDQETQIKYIFFEQIRINITIGRLYLKDVSQAQVRQQEILVTRRIFSGWLRRKEILGDLKSAMSTWRRCKQAVDVKITVYDIIFESLSE